ncbi:MAG: SurA N-terminal domain-containing protein [Methylococcales bacterium]|nr:SurA N-terminal domain-containing protein [Methylococcales bacterium]
MLQKIREKSQGVFAWVILIVICVPFALWGIQNYIGGASEDALVTVGDREFFQNDLNKAYQQYNQNLAGMKIDEAIIRQQATLKLVKDEVLLQHVHDQDLIISDKKAKEFIQGLEYFQVDGKFDKKRYKALLSAQRLSSEQFVQRIKQAQVMEQYQRGILSTSFATDYDIKQFFKIQNQKRSIHYMTVPVVAVTEAPKESAIQTYYQENQNRYQTTEKVSIEYIQLSLNDLAKKITLTDAQLKAFYEEQKDVYTTKERRKISHILFLFGKDGNDEAVLAKAQAAQKQLATKSFKVLAAEVSEDEGTAQKGGDLGLFEVGGLEASLEKVVTQLTLGQVSAPVKSSFGYHLLTVTKLVPVITKPFDEVKAEVTNALQRKSAETDFYEMAERLAEVSYENTENLTVAAETIGATIKKTELFSKETGKGIAQNPIIRAAAFSEDVLKGNNSESLEIGSDKVIVLRLSKHQPASVQPLATVKAGIITQLLTQKSQQHASNTATELKQQLLNGKDIQTLATEKALKLNTLDDLTRQNKLLASPINHAIFKAAKPSDNKPTFLTVALNTGEQYIIALNKVTEGILSNEDKKQLKLAKFNLAKMLGETTFEAVLANLQANADIVIKNNPSTEK